MTEFNDVVEMLNRNSETGKYNAVTGHSERHQYVDIDRVHANLRKVARELGYIVVKVKEDATENDGQVRVWFEECELRSADLV